MGGGETVAVRLEDNTMNDTELESAAGFSGRNLHAVDDTQSLEINKLADALAQATGGITGAGKQMAEAATGEPWMP